jgi:gamma-glutamylcyclotransferase (GGCT)/AIG2-like uncharacterized protein YtfP
MIQAVFVYGTLKRGQCRGQMWPAEPLSIQLAWTTGSLFSGPEYPAMIRGQDHILGELWTFAADDMPQVLEVLDEIEGTNQPGMPDLYHRVVLDVQCLDSAFWVRAYSYQYAKDPALDGFVPVMPGPASYVSWPVGSDPDSE